MSKIAALRGAIESVTAEAESRVTGVLRASRDALIEIIGAVEFQVRQAVYNAFDFVETIVGIVFDILDSVVTAALGSPVDTTDSEEDN